jgi:hypothetical protein
MGSGALTLAGGGNTTLSAMFALIAVAFLGAAGWLSAYAVGNNLWLSIPVAALLLTGAGIALTASRARAAPRIIIVRDRVEIRGLYRWRRWRTSSITGFMCENRTVEILGGQELHILTVILADGEVWRPSGFASPASAAEEEGSVLSITHEANLILSRAR